MRGVLAEADVADDDKLRHGLLDCGNSSLHGALGIPCGRADLILVLGQSEHFDGRNAERSELFGKLHGTVD